MQETTACLHFARRTCVYTTNAQQIEVTDFGPKVLGYK